MIEKEIGGKDKDLALSLLLPLLLLLLLLLLLVVIRPGCPSSACLANPGIVVRVDSLI
jgi:hypothetical protein